MRLAFYNGRDHGTWLDRVIASHDAGADRGPFSHAELVFGRADDEGRSLCFSSSWRDGGVRFKWLALEHPRGRWTQVQVPLDDRGLRRVRAWCAGRLGGRYDLPGVLAFKLPLVRQRLNWWFCSEICVAALQQGGLLGGYAPHRISPNRLYHLACARKRITSHA